MIEFKTLIPFVLATSNGRTPTLNTARVIESLVIAGITAGVTMWGMQQRMDMELAQMRASMAEIKIDAANRHQRIESKLDELAADVHQIDIAQARSEAAAEKRSKR